MESRSKDSAEKISAAEKTSRTLQQIYLKAQIPFTPTEPDGLSNGQPVGDIPRIPLIMRDQQEKAESAPAAPTPAVPDIDFNLLNQIVQTTNGQHQNSSSSRSPSNQRNTPPPPMRNPYEQMAPPPHNYSNYRGSSPNYRGSSPLINDQRYSNERSFPRDNYRPHDRHHDRPYDRPHGGGGQYGDRDRSYRRDASPQGYQRRSRSPPRNDPYRRPDNSYRNQGYNRR